MIHAAPLLPGSFDPQAEPWPQSCPSCGCDFAQRPPRSYAEMEGLLGRPLSLDCPPRSGRIESSLIQRWLAFLFFVMLLFVALIHLTAATFQAR